MNTVQKGILTVSLVGSAAIIAHVGNVANSLLLFLFAGIIPGTNIIVPPLVSLATLIILASIIIVIFRRSILKDIVRARHQHSLPTRRFSSL